MKIILFLRKLAKNFLSKRKSIFEYDVNLQREFLEFLGDPVDDIERSFFQYKCQMKLSGILYKALANLISPAFIFIYIIRHYKNSSNSREQNADNYDAIFFANSLTDKYIPEELSTEYGLIKTVELTDHCSLSKSDLLFLKKIVKGHPISWFYHMKILLKIAVYNEQITRYNPTAVIASAEYSFTSSVMTAYCEANNVKHINIQHGEKMYYMEDSFFRFHYFYLWDERYIDMFIRLKADPSQFVVSTPMVLKNIKMDIDAYKGTIKEYDYKYYLAAESKSELIRIKETLLKLPKDKSICMRPHPIYTDKQLVEDLFSKDFDIEDPKEVKIEQSLAGCIMALSLFSTVLQQAYYGGIATAIDNVSFPDYYRTLEKIEYIMIKRSNKLSEIMQNK